MSQTHLTAMCLDVPLDTGGNGIESPSSGIVALFLALQKAVSLGAPGMQTQRNFVKGFCNKGGFCWTKYRVFMSRGGGEKLVSCGAPFGRESCSKRKSSVLGP